MYSGASLFPPSFSSWHLITNHPVFFSPHSSWRHISEPFLLGNNKEKWSGAARFSYFVLSIFFYIIIIIFTICVEKRGRSVAGHHNASQNFLSVLLLVLWGRQEKKEDTDAAAFLLSLISSLGIQTQMCCVFQLFLSFFSPSTTSYVL